MVDVLPYGACLLRSHKASNLLNTCIPLICAPPPCFLLACFKQLLPVTKMHSFGSVSPCKGPLCKNHIVAHLATSRCVTILPALAPFAFHILMSLSRGILYKPSVVSSYLLACFFKIQCRKRQSAKNQGMHSNYKALVGGAG